MKASLQEGVNALFLLLMRQRKCDQYEDMVKERPKA